MSKSQDKYIDIDEDFEVLFKDDVLTKSTVVVIINTESEAGAEIHFGDNGNVWVSYLKSGNSTLPQ
jgi:hypothetical protein